MCMISRSNLMLKTSLTLELPIVNAKLLLPKSAKIIGLLKNT